ncbi:transposase family protein, partial [Streptomyces lunaelactis]
MTKNNEPAEGVSLVYQCHLNLSTGTITYLADLLRSHLKAIRSPFRSLPPGRIAVLVLAMLRHDQRLLDLAHGNGVPESTLRRWRDEMLDLLAARAPRLDRALRQIAARGGEVVLIDGTLIPTQRRTGKANRPNYSGKHHRHGLHFLALTDERGKLVWISAARRDKIVEHLKAAGPGALADLGFIGVDKPKNLDDQVIVTGYKATRARKLTAGHKQANQILAAARAPVEHAFANLKAWRTLTKLRTESARATALLRALLVLTNLEANRRRHADERSRTQTPAQGSQTGTDSEADAVRRSRRYAPGGAP